MCNANALQCMFGFFCAQKFSASQTVSSIAFEEETMKQEVNVANENLTNIKNMLDTRLMEYTDYVKGQIINQRLGGNVGQQPGNLDALKEQSAVYQVAERQAQIAAAHQKAIFESTEIVPRKNMIKTLEMKEQNLVQRKKVAEENLKYYQVAGSSIENGINNSIRDSVFKFA